MRTVDPDATALSLARADAYLATPAANDAHDFRTLVRMTRVATLLPELSADDLRRLQAVVSAA